MRRRASTFQYLDGRCVHRTSQGTSRLSPVTSRRSKRAIASKCKQQQQCDVYAAFTPPNLRENPRLFGFFSDLGVHVDGFAALVAHTIVLQDVSSPRLRSVFVHFDSR